MSQDLCRRSFQCWMPSYSTATFHCRQPMSTRIRRSRNSICVSGRGRPPRTRISRTLVSCGDSAPPSTRSSTPRSRATPPSAGMCSRNCSDARRRDAGGVHQRVDDRYRLFGGSRAADVECGAGGRRRVDAADHAHLVGHEAPRASDDPRCRMPVGANDLRRCARVDPLGAEHRCGGQAAERRTGGQPGGLGSDTCGEFHVPRNVDVAIDSGVVTSESAPGEPSAADRHAAEKGVHAATVGTRTDESGPRARISGRSCAQAPRWGQRKAPVRQAHRGFFVKGLRSPYRPCHRSGRPRVRTPSPACRRRRPRW
ncbi:Uncharacterised protein [Mycolicibacterium aurum]|uniref:Uncharacterized protein n=1 Tax=Mycolicibacterium aurum TaxID=1791 RepID=A0A448IGF4_MYCAU|nr:Uncharacterised protein [Mycolicibacterium aurum]